MSVIITILLFAGVPFTAIQLMPGRKTFFFLTTIYVVVIGYCGYEITRPITEENDGIGTAFGMVLGALICLGAITGIITKAITLQMASKGVSHAKRMMVRFAGFMAIPAFIFVPMLAETWNHRLPSASCNYDMARFSIDGEGFQAPTFDIVSAYRGNGKNNDPVKNNIYFFAPKMLREFCAMSDNGKKPVNVNALSLRMSELARERNNDRFVSLCAKAKWPDAICSYKEYSVPSGYPDRIGLYDKTKFSAGNIGGGYTYERIKEDRAKADKSSDVPGFAFDGHNYYWVEENAGEGVQNLFALSCFKSSSGLYCRHDEKWSGNVYVTYGMNVSLKDPVEDARKIRKTTFEFVNLLRPDRQ